MHISGGVLRDSVIVTRDLDLITIDFALWRLTLRSAHVEQSARLSDLLARRPVAAVDPNDRPPIANLFKLLAAQGCLVPFSPNGPYALECVRTQFLWFCNESYGRYYSHQLWSAMRVPVIPLPLIRQWMARTYFLSRFAGVTAAIASNCAPCASVADAFRKSAIEEFSHCDDYYAMPAILFGGASVIDDHIAPSASFLAFDEQMTAIARNDWLAHLFVALFQEQTARYRDYANNFYDRIEVQLDQPGLLAGWREHIGFDEDHAHEGDLIDLFGIDLVIPGDELQRSFDEACLTISLLVDGLDEVLTLGGLGLDPRECARTLHLREANIRGIRWLLQESNHVFKVADAPDLARALAEIVTTPDATSGALAAYLQVQANEICRASLLCLASCGSHEQIILVGRVAALLTKEALLPTCSPKTIRIVRNRLENLARHPEHFMFVACLSIHLLRRFAPDAYEVNSVQERAIHEATQGVSVRVPLPELLEVGLRWIDALEYGYRVWGKDWPGFAVGVDHEQ